MWLACREGDGAGVSRGQDPEIIMKGALQTSAKKPSGYVFPGAE